MSQLWKDGITLPRLTILDDREGSYLVEFGGTEYEVSKSDETSFSLGAPRSTKLTLRPEQRVQLIVPETSFRQDVDVPKHFLEPMIVHELREAEYKRASLDDAHERAVHDETLYVLKYFSSRKQKEYFLFAQQYRRETILRKLREKTAERRKDLLLDLNLRKVGFLRWEGFGHRETEEVLYVRMLSLDEWSGPADLKDAPFAFSDSPAYRIVLECPVNIATIELLAERGRTIDSLQFMESEIVDLEEIYRLLYEDIASWYLPFVKTLEQRGFQPMRFDNRMWRSEPPETSDRLPLLFLSHGRSPIGEPRIVISGFMLELLGAGLNEFVETDGVAEMVENKASSAFFWELQFSPDNIDALFEYYAKLKARLETYCPGGIGEQLLKTRT